MTYFLNNRNLYINVNLIRYIDTFSRTIYFSDTDYFDNISIDDLTKIIKLMNL